MTLAGLRPGEKLYEELLVKTEELDKTPNSMIFIERDTPLCEHDINVKLDLSLHPAWQRDFIDYLVMFINNCYKENKVQIIMTTHSPLCLSNIPKSNIIYLQKTENGTKVDISEHKETFGANLYEILDDRNRNVDANFRCQYKDLVARDPGMPVKKY